MTVQQILGSEPAPHSSPWFDFRRLVAALLFLVTLLVSVSLAQRDGAAGRDSQPALASERGPSSFHEVGRRVDLSKPPPGVVIF